MAKLTPLSKVLITVVVAGAVGTGFCMSRDRPDPEKRTSSPGAASAEPPIVPVRPQAPAIPPGCPDKPEVRIAVAPWNAQAGLLLATGGPQAAEGSLMCKHGVNLKLVREVAVDQVQFFMLVFAEDSRSGAASSPNGVHLASIMGDGAAVFLKSLNERLIKVGPDHQAVVIGSTGTSRGEDKFMGPKAWLENPEKARGALVAGSLRDGDWNLAVKWLADHKIRNNPDDAVYDPDALNWHPTIDAIDAAEKYIHDYCTDIENARTHAMEKHCIDGVVTKTPGDAMVAEEKGGLVTITSTKESPAQMPSVLVGTRKWMETNRPVVEGMLAAIFEAGDQIKSDPAALRRAAEISAVVYGDRDAAFWENAYRGQTAKDKQGLAIELGGSSVSNLADNLALFGLAKGSTNTFAETYTTFADLVKSQYPAAMKTYDPAEKVIDTSYLAAVAKLPDAPRAEAPATKSPPESGTRRP